MTRASLVTSLTLAGALAFGTAAAAADVDIDVHIGSPPADKVVYVYRDYYGFPKDDVILIVEEYPEDAPAILEIARLAGVAPLKVIELRRQHRSLFEILLHFGLSPQVLFVAIPAEVDLGPPYGKAWGYWRKHGKHWPRGVALSDAEFRGVTRVKLLSRYFHEDPAVVVRNLHGADPTAVLVREVDAKKLGKPSTAGQSQQGKGQGQEHGKDQGKSDGQDHGKGQAKEQGDGEKSQGKGQGKGQGQGKGKGK